MITSIATGDKATTIMVCAIVNWARHASAIIPLAALF